MIGEKISQIDWVSKNAVWIESFIWTLVHSIWQSAIVCLIIYLFYRFSKNTKSSTLYLINTTGYFSCALISLSTFIHLLPVPRKELTYITPPDTPSYIQLTYSFSADVKSSSNLINLYATSLFYIWAIIFSFLLIKFFIDHVYVNWLVKNTLSSVDLHLKKSADDLAQKIGLKRKIELKISHKISYPCTLGYLNNLVILPVSLLTQLSSEQIELIILHELSHIKRYDYLVNSLQLIIKKCFFFNPFIYWISSKMDEERENACDDLVLKNISSPLTYAKALTEFVEMRKELEPTTALIGSKNILSKRIKRLFSPRVDAIESRTKAILIFLTILLGFGLTTASCSIQSKKEKTQLVKATLIQHKELQLKRCSNELKSLKLDNPDVILQLNTSKLTCSELHDVLKTADITISNKLLSLAELKALKIKNCFNELNDIELKNPNREVSLKYNNLEQGVGFDFKNADCKNFTLALMTLDGAVELAGVKMKFENKPLAEVFEYAKKYCPEETKDIQIKQPESLFSIDGSNIQCAEIAKIFESMNKRNLYTGNEKVKPLPIDSEFTRKPEIEYLIHKKVIFDPRSIPSYENFYSACKIEFYLSAEGKAHHIQYECLSSDPIAHAQVQIKLKDSLENTNFSEYLKSNPEKKLIKLIMLFGSPDGIDKNWAKIEPFYSGK